MLSAPVLAVLPLLLLDVTPKKKPKADPLAQLIAEAKKDWNQRLADAKAGADCAKVIGADTRFDLNQADPTPAEVKKNVGAYVTMARCAEKEKFYLLMLDLAMLIAKATPKTPQPALFVRAAMGLGAFTEADDLFQKASAAHPTDADLMLSGAKLRCRQRNWPECDSLATQAITLAASLPAAQKDAIVNRAFKYQARVALHKGDLDTLEINSLLLSLGEEADQANAKALDDALVAAKTHRLVIEPEFVSHVALGVYHLTGKLEALKPLVTVVVTNIGVDRQVRVEASIPGVTSVASKTQSLRAGKEAVFELVPPLLPTFDITSVRATKSASVELKVTAIGEGGKDTLVLQESREISLEPRDFLPMSAAVDKEKRVRKLSYLGAWVTPNAKAVEAFLTEAKKLAPGESFSGQQAATKPQVKALFEALKAKGVSYVMDPHVMSGLGFGQRTRLPSEVLASTNAQCLEGAVLYASLMESIGLRPMIIFIPGHAFVGWHGSAGDGKGGEKTVFLLETTMTHDGDFDDAVEVGKREFLAADEDGEASMISIAGLRKAGITPQPFD